MKKKSIYGIVLLSLVTLASCDKISTGDGPGPLAETTYPQAEYDRGKIVFMHEPEEELLFGTLHPEAALFKKYLNADSAVVEHRGYRRLLSNLGFEVHTIHDILLKGCLDADGNWLDTPETKALRELASQSIRFVPTGELDPEEVENYKLSLLQQYTPKDIVRYIFLQPIVSLHKTEINSGLEAEYRFNPLMNLFFTRDQVISTAKGIVVGKMHSEQRKRECELVEFCLNKIGHAPIYRIQGEDAFLEGGDYIPMRDYSLIGRGLRTTQAAIRQLMDNDLIGKDTLVVVDDPWKSQIQMHLDTYFNVIDSNLVTLCSNRVKAKSGDKDYLTVEIYAKDGAGRYELVEKGESFLDFLHRRGIDIISISPEDEEHFGNNFLCIEGREIAMVAGQSRQLQKTLQDKGVTVHFVPLTNLTYGYGAAHCMTQVIGRSKRTTK